MRARRRGGVVAATSLIGGLSAALAAELPRAFRLEPVVGGLTEPSAMASTPDGRILVAERTTGYVRQVRLGELQSGPLCAVSVNATGEGGLLGIAVHPRFLHNGWIYLCSTDSVSGRNKATRFTRTATGCTSRPDILSDLGAGLSFLRNGGGIAFGFDGKLYVATGDVEDSSNGRNDAVLYGKALRVNDDGLVPADNPTPGSLVFAKGVRNGRGLDVNDAGKVFTIDAGRDTGPVYGELNHVPAGGHLGWDAVTGNSGGSTTTRSKSGSRPSAPAGSRSTAARASPTGRPTGRTTTTTSWARTATRASPPPTTTGAASASAPTTTRRAARAAPTAFRATAASTTRPLGARSGTSRTSPVRAERRTATTPAARAAARAWTSPTSRASRTFSSPASRRTGSTVPS